ncbi:MAG TPA: hypothetical protein VKA70_08740 [Blastocatellia bacterium]|nr:hypothetical protein [Blastocatellia bacterium]
MICNDCGTTLVNTARFCASCGSPTYRDQAETQLQQSKTTPLNPDSTDNQGFASIPPAPAYTTAAAAGLAPYTACIYHTNVAAAGACVGCGHPFCRACMYNYAGRNYCVNCWARLNPATQRPQYFQQPYGYGYAPNQYYYQPAVQTKNPGLALFLSFIMPGAGQLYNGDVGKAVLLFLAFWILVWIFIGWIFWIVAMVDAYHSAQNINLGNRA